MKLKKSEEKQRKIWINELKYTVKHILPGTTYLHNKRKCGG